MIVTCVQCGRPVEKRETLEMPNGLTCLDPCYAFLERMMEQMDPLDFTVEFDDDN